MCCLPCPDEDPDREEKETRPLHTKQKQIKHPRLRLQIPPSLSWPPLPPAACGPAAAPANIFIAVPNRAGQSRSVLRQSVSSLVERAKGTGSAVVGGWEHHGLGCSGIDELRSRPVPPGPLLLRGRNRRERLRIRALHLPTANIQADRSEWIHGAVLGHAIHLLAAQLPHLHVVRPPLRLLRGRPRRHRQLHRRRLPARLHSRIHRLCQRKGEVEGLWSPGCRLCGLWHDHVC